MKACPSGSALAKKKKKKRRDVCIVRPSEAKNVQCVAQNSDTNYSSSEVEDS